MTKEVPALVSLDREAWERAVRAEMAESDDQSDEHARAVGRKHIRDHVRVEVQR